MSVIINNREAFHCLAMQSKILGSSRDLKSDVTREQNNITTLWDNQTTEERATRYKREILFNFVDVQKMDERIREHAKAYIEKKLAKDPAGSTILTPRFEKILEILATGKMRNEQEKAAHRQEKLKQQTVHAPPAAPAPLSDREAFRSILLQNSDACKQAPRILLEKAQKNQQAADDAGGCSMGIVYSYQRKEIHMKDGPRLEWGDPRREDLYAERQRVMTACRLSILFDFIDTMKADYDIRQKAKSHVAKKLEKDAIEYSVASPAFKKLLDIFEEGWMPNDLQKAEKQKDKQRVKLEEEKEQIELELEKTIADHFNFDLTSINEKLNDLQVSASSFPKLQALLNFLSNPDVYPVPDKNSLNFPTRDRELLRFFDYMMAYPEKKQEFEQIRAAKQQKLDAINKKLKELQ